ncbi:hypothetical protein WJX79_001522 [Trebouxia sp. C0005]
MASALKCDDIASVTTQSITLRTLPDSSSRARQLLNHRFTAATGVDTNQKRKAHTNPFTLVHSHELPFNWWK